MAANRMTTSVHILYLRVIPHVYPSNVPFTHLELIVIPRHQSIKVDMHPYLISRLQARWSSLSFFHVDVLNYT